MNALIDFLGDELRPTAGRYSATLRIVITTVLIVIISMGFEVPEAALSAYMVLFISKEESYTTALSGVMLTIGLTVGIALGLLLNIAFVDMPLARIAIMTLAIFMGMWLSRTFLIGPLAFAISFIIMMTMTLADFIPITELIVRAHLWLWVVFAFPVVLTIFSFVIAPKFSPQHRFRAQILQRLLSCDQSLSSQTGIASLDPKAFDPAYWLAHGIQALSNLQRLSQHNSELPSHWRANSSLTLLSRLTILSQQLAATRQRGWSAAQLKTLLSNQNRLRGFIAELQGCPPEVAHIEVNADGPLSNDAELLLSDLGVVLDQLSNLSHQSDPLEAKPKQPLFVADAWLNPEYLQFAFKVTLAAMLCYALYNLLDWQGIHTCMITCTIIALSSNGATLHRGTLRIVGALIGGFMGVIAVVFIFPFLQSIVGLVIVVAIGTAIAAWVSLGSDRISYAGLQIGLAFFMCVLQGFGPATDLEVIRDRLMGILLGNAMMALVFSSLWPVYSHAHLRQQLQRCLSGAAQILETGKLKNEGGALQTELEKATQLVSLQSFEAVFNSKSQNEELAEQQRMLANMQMLAPNLAILLRAEVHLKAENAAPNLIEQHQQQLARIGLFLSQLSKGEADLSAPSKGLQTLQATAEAASSSVVQSLFHQHLRIHALLARMV